MQNKSNVGIIGLTTLTAGPPAKTVPLVGIDFSDWIKKDEGPLTIEKAINHLIRLISTATSQSDVKALSKELRDSYSRFISIATPSTLILLDNAAQILLGSTSSLQVVAINLETHRRFSKKSIIVRDLLKRSIKSKKLEVFTIPEKSSFVTFQGGQRLNKYVQFGDILIWALDKRILLSNELQEVLGVFQPSDGTKQKFNPQKTRQQSAAQFVWYYESITMKSMAVRDVFKHFCPEEGYDDKKTVHDTIKIVNPIPLKLRTRPKNIKIQESPGRFPCKPIPGVLVGNEKKQFVDLRRLAVVCETIKECQSLSSYPKIQLDKIENHPMVGMYIKELPIFMKLLVRRLLFDSCAYL